MRKPRIEQNWAGQFIVRDSRTEEILAECNSAEAAGAYVAGIQEGQAPIAHVEEPETKGFFDELFGC